MSIQSSLAAVALILVPSVAQDEPPQSPLEMSGEALRKHLRADVDNVRTAFGALREKVNALPEPEFARLRTEAFVRASLDPLTGAGVETLRTLRAELEQLVPSEPPSKATAPIEAKRDTLANALAAHQGLVDALGLTTKRAPLSAKAMIASNKTIFSVKRAPASEDRARITEAQNYTYRELRGLWINTTIWSRYRATLRSLKTDAEVLAKCPSVSLEVRDRYAELAARYAQLETLAANYWAAT